MQIDPQIERDWIRGFEQMAAVQHELAVAQGLWGHPGTVRPIANPIALCHSELSEALEGARMHDPPDKNIADMSTIEVQLGDAVGVLLDMAAGYKLRIAEAVIRKHRFNCTRGWMHGGKAF